VKHFKKLLCPKCQSVKLFRGGKDGAFHCPDCNTRIFYNDGVVRVDED